MPVGGIIHRPGSMGGQLTGNGLFAGLMGMAGAAHADLSDVIWNQQQQQRVYVPHVDTSVRHRR
jgi:hypothetical protein